MSHPGFRPRLALGAIVALTAIPAMAEASLQLPGARSSAAPTGLNAAGPQVPGGQTARTIREEPAAAGPVAGNAPGAGIAGAARAGDVAEAVGTEANSSAPVAPETVAREWFGAGQKWSDWSRGSGDWAGLRTRLEKTGVAVSGSNVSDWSSVAASGRREAGVGRGLGEIGATFDLATIAGIPGASVYVQVAAKRGGNGAARSENVQGFSSIDADDFAGLGEAWFEQRLAGGKLRVKVGHVDANSEFAQVEHAADFINPSMGYSPTILGLPTYPLAVPSLNVFAHPTDRFYVGAGIYDGQRAAAELSPAPEAGAFVITEAGMTWRGGSRRMDGRAAVGLWRHTARLYRLDQRGLAQGARGLFITFDQDIWHERDASEEDEQGVEIFGQFGSANPIVSAVDRHIGFGLTWTGLAPGRDQDRIGIGITSVRTSPLASENGEGGAETAYALFYKIQLNQWLSVKPDIQYIRHVVGSRTGRRVVAATCRLEVAF